MARRAHMPATGHPPLRLQRRIKACFVFAAAACVFALLMLAPRLALALIVPVCEHDVQSMAPAVKLETSCENAHDSQADPGDVNAAPMCGEQGVSKEAPPRILPIVDARIEALATAFCSSEFDGPACGSQDGKAPVHSGPVLAEPALPSLTDALPQTPLSGFSSFVPVEGRPRLGYGRGVFHPPR